MFWIWTKSSGTSCSEPEPGISTLGSTTSAQSHSSRILQQPGLDQQMRQPQRHQRLRRLRLHQRLQHRHLPIVVKPMTSVTQLGIQHAAKALAHALAVVPSSNAHLQQASGSVKLVHAFLPSRVSGGYREWTKAFMNTPLFK